MNDRMKLFLENFLIYGLGSVLSKVAPFVMLPIITRLMPDTTYYGLIDLSSVTVSFGTAIAVMGMYDAMFRLFFEKEDVLFKKEVCSSALFFVFLSGLTISITLFIFRSYFSQLIFNSENYVNLLCFTSLSIITSTLSTIIIAPTRMQNKRKVFLFTNAITPVLGYCVSIPLLLRNNYLYALPSGALFTSVLMILLFSYLNKDWFSVKHVRFPLISEMLKIGAPLMPGFIIYWIFSACDRVMIAHLLDNRAVGVYGIGLRVASVSQFIYVAFAGGWQYFAFSTMKDEDQVELTSKIFEYLSLVTCIVFSVITPFSTIVFKLFFTDGYINGYIVFPYLFLSPLLLMLYQTISNQFLVVKKTWPSTMILFVGALVNILLNYILIQMAGIEGAAISTLAGYTISLLIAYAALLHMKLLVLNKRTILVFSMLSLYIILWRVVFYSNFMPSVILSIVVIMMYFLLYKKDINQLFSNIKQKVQKTA